MKNFKTFIKEFNASGGIGGGFLETDVITPSQRVSVIQYSLTQGQGHTKKSGTFDAPTEMPYVTNNTKVTSELNKIVNKLMSVLDPSEVLKGNHVQSMKRSDDGQPVKPDGPGRPGIPPRIEPQRPRPPQQPPDGPGRPGIPPRIEPAGPPKNPK